MLIVLPLFGALNCQECIQRVNSMDKFFNARRILTNTVFVLTLFVGSLAHAAGGGVKDPNASAADRYGYYPTGFNAGTV